MGSRVDSLPRRPGAFLMAGLGLASRKGRIMKNTEPVIGIEKSEAPLRLQSGLGFGEPRNARHNRTIDKWMVPGHQNLPFSLKSESGYRPAEMSCELIINAAVGV